MRSWTPRAGLLTACAVALVAGAVRATLWSHLPFLTTEVYAAQLIPLELLRDDPLGSIWRFHSQPPLFNAIVALVLHGFGELAEPAFPALLVALGLGSCALVTAAVHRVTQSVAVAFVSGLSLAILPSTLLFESWLFYTHFEFFMLALLSWLIASLHQCMHERVRRRVFVRLGAACVTLTLLRSAYHPLWLAVLLGGWALTEARLGTGRHAPGALRSRAVVYGGWATLLLALSLAWPLKNAVQFGFFGSSSWMGMSLAKIAVYPLPLAQRTAWVADGTLSPFAIKAPFLPIDGYQPLPPPAPDLHPVLQLPLNDPRYIDVSAQLGRDAEWVMLHRPADYLPSVYAAAERFFEPTTLYSSFIGSLVGPIRSYEGAVRDLLYPGGSTLPAIALYFMPTLVGLAVWLHALLRRGDVRDALQGWLIGGTLAYAFLVFNLTELGENNRFRFTLLPLIVFGNAWVGARLRAAWKARAAEDGALSRQPASPVAR